MAEEKPLADIERDDAAPRHGAAIAFQSSRSGLVGAGDDPRHQAVGLGLLGAHPEVPLGVLRDPLDGLAGLAGDQGVDPVTRLADLFGLDLDVGDLPAYAAGRLVQQEAGVRQADAVLLLAA